MSHEGTNIKASGILKDRSRNLDRIVGGEIADQLARRLVNTRKLLGQPGPCGEFYFGSEPSDFPEKPYLLIRIPADHKHVSRMPKRTRTAFGGTGQDCLVQLLEQEGFK